MPQDSLAGKIYKRSLKGLARLFVQSESRLVSWNKLKEALLKEFSTKVTCARSHTMLSQRKMKESESVQEYLIVMRELASRGMIEMEAVFDYVLMIVHVIKQFFTVQSR